MQSLKKFCLLAAVAAVACGSVQAEENCYEKYRESAISSASGTPWNAERHIELVRHANDLVTTCPIPKAYPISIDDLEEIYGVRETIPFFAYSSMIDMESAAVKAISVQGAATQTPAIAFGIQRTFNRAMQAETVAGGFGPLARENDLAILNCFYKKDAVVNGVLFDLPIEDLQILTKREVGYNLIPVTVMRWDDACHSSQPQAFIAYTFQTPDYKGQGERFTSPNVNPIPPYFNNLQKGINKWGSDFTAMWWATTYLADQKTVVNALPYENIDLK